MTATRLPPVSYGLGLYTGQRPPGLSASYRDAPVLATAAEVAGFDAFWVSEHHGLRDDYLPAPLTLLASAARATRRIALGTGVAVAPLHHPLRLAEEASVVDELCEGRLVLGLGSGYARHELAAFGVDPRRRGVLLEDQVALLRTAWQGEPFAWEGPALKGSVLRSRPAPPEEIPIWLGGYAPRAIDRAARIGDGYLLGRGDPSVVQAVAERLADADLPDDFTFAVNVVVLLDEPGGRPDSARAGLHHQQRVYDELQRRDDAHAGLIGDRTVAPTPPTGADAPRAACAIVDDIGGLVERLAPFSRVHVVLRALFPEPLTPQLERITALGSSVLPQLPR